MALKNSSQNIVLSMMNRVVIHPTPNQTMASGIQAIPEIELANTPTGSRKRDTVRFIPARMPKNMPSGRPIRAASATRLMLENMWLVSRQSLCIAKIAPVDGQSSCRVKAASQTAPSSGMKTGGSQPKVELACHVPISTMNGIDPSANLRMRWRPKRRCMPIHILSMMLIAGPAPSARLCRLQTGAAGNGRG